jgi:hypothetical protein
METIDSLKMDLKQLATDTRMRFLLNHFRVEALLDTVKASKKPIGEDILRATVVLLHAALKDFLRTVVTHSVCADFNEKGMKNVLLIGAAKEFELSVLIKHKDKTVRELLTESVKAHYSRYNVSDYKKLEKALEICGIGGVLNPAKHRPNLEALMRRRIR